MLYFKTVKFENTDPEIVEKAVRAYSSEREDFLDLCKTSVSNNNDMYFLRRESKNGLQISRLRTRFESIFPRIIVRFNNKSDVASYQIRYCFCTAVVLLLCVLSFAITLLAIRTDLFENIIGVFIFFVMVLALTRGEIISTRNRIIIAIERTRVTESIST